MIDLPVHQYKLEDGLWHMWNWTLPNSDVEHITDCGIKMGKVKDNRLSGVSGVDKSTLCPKCFSSLSDL